jgi:hypothetical protein
VIPRDLRDVVRVLGAMAALAGGACSPHQPPVVMAPAPGCDLVGRAWQQTSTGPCAASTWRFERRQDGHYAATETGCSGATGVARWNGSTVTLDFQYAGGAGQYIWPLDTQCRASPGEVGWNSSPAVGQTASSTLAARAVDRTSIRHYVFL